MYATWPMGFFYMEVLVNKHCDWFRPLGTSSFFMSSHLAAACLYLGFMCLHSVLAGS